MNSLPESAVELCRRLSSFGHLRSRLIYQGRLPNLLGKRISSHPLRGEILKKLACYEIEETAVAQLWRNCGISNRSRLADYALKTDILMGRGEHSSPRPIMIAAI